MAIASLQALLRHQPIADLVHETDVIGTDLCCNDREIDGKHMIPLNELETLNPHGLCSHHILSG